MSEPKSKLSKSRRGMRRSHDSIISGASAICDNCSSIVQPHRACTSCGYYKGREVLQAKVTKNKK